MKSMRSSYLVTNQGNSDINEIEKIHANQANMIYGLMVLTTFTFSLLLVLIS